MGYMYEPNAIISCKDSELNRQNDAPWPQVKHLHVGCAEEADFPGIFVHKKLADGFKQRVFLRYAIDIGLDDAVVPFDGLGIGEDAARVDGEVAVVVARQDL